MRKKAKMPYNFSNEFVKAWNRLYERKLKAYFLDNPQLDLNAINSLNNTLLEV